MSENPSSNVRLPHILLETSAERLKTLILNYNTMTSEEIRRCLILTHREIYEALDFYTNETQPNVPRL
jgi:hypothetical protein